ncbi:MULTISPECIES: hypothetical protein [Nitrosomonas]|uniref:hypothetical protein n=1 Tax=Nitrosomonas TaxID=914 RepID=UPI0011E6A5DD|nr:MULTISPECIES: hypothetical protein [Nitrosomonas]
MFNAPGLVSEVALGLGEVIPTLSPLQEAPETHEINYPMPAPQASRSGRLCAPEGQFAPYPFPQLRSAG